MLIDQKISNNKTFNNITRNISIMGININAETCSLSIYYRILYRNNNEDVTSMFNPQVPEWHIDNNQLILVRDENFQPILNPDYKEVKDDSGNITNKNEQYLTMPAFDYLISLMLDKNIPLKNILSAYIKDQDDDGRFNF